MVPEAPRQWSQTLRMEWNGMEWNGMSVVPEPPRQWSQRLLGVSLTAQMLVPRASMPAHFHVETNNYELLESELRALVGMMAQAALH